MAAALSLLLVGRHLDIVWSLDIGSIPIAAAGWWSRFSMEFGYRSLFLAAAGVVSRSGRFYVAATSTIGSCFGSGLGLVYSPGMAAFRLLLLGGGLDFAGSWDVATSLLPLLLLLHWDFDLGIGDLIWVWLGICIQQLFFCCCCFLGLVLGLV